MFERIKKFFRRNGMSEINRIIDHEKITMEESEYNRIIENRRIYQQNFDDVEYTTANSQEMKRPYHSLNTAKIIAKTLSRLIYNEGVDIELEGEKENAFLQSVFDDNNFATNFREELEAGYAIGGLAIRPYYDPTSDKIKFSYVQADSFFPLQSNTSEITECAFATKTIINKNKTTYFTLLEFHEWDNEAYIITNELYKSDNKDKLGKRVSLTSLDKYANLQEQTVIHGLTRPLFVYIKLAEKNNKDLHSPLSISLTDLARDTIVQINDKYDQFMNDVNNSALKIIGSDQFFRTRIDQFGKIVRRYDTDTDAFLLLNGEEIKPEAFAPTLRTEEYTTTINFLLRLVEFQTGFSPGTFSFDGTSVKTATQVVSENSMSYQTRNDNVKNVEAALHNLVTTIFELAYINKLYSGKNKSKLKTDFDDGVFDSRDSQLTYYGKAVTLGLMPKTEAMQKLYGLSEERAKEWLININQESMELSEENYRRFENTYGKEE